MDDSILHKQIIIVIIAKALRLPWSCKKSLLHNRLIVARAKHLVQDIDAVQVLGSLAQTLSHGLFSGPKTHAGIVVLLVGDIISVGVSDLSLKVVVVLGFVLTDSVPVCPLGISVNVHLDNTGLNGVLDILDIGTRTSVEDEKHGLVVSIANFLGHVFLGVVKDFGSELDISWGVNSVDISERSGAGEGGVFDRRKLFVGVHDLFGLSVKTAGVNIRVINTIFFSSSHTEFEFKENVNLGEFLHVFPADSNVLLKGFLGKVKHVRREKGFSVGSIVFLVGLKKTVHPWQPSLLAMVSVENDGNSVKGSDLTDVLGSGNASSDGGIVVIVGKGFSGNELTTSLGESDHDGSSVLGGGFHTGVNGVGSNNVDSWDGETGLLGVFEKVDKGLSSDDTRLDRGGKLGESLLIAKINQK